MTKLPLAVDIADELEKAAASDEPLNIAETADDLLSRHPEAETPKEDIVDVLQDEVHADAPATKPDP